MDRILIVAVASRLPEWVEAGCREYVARMPRDFAVRRVQVKPESRTQGLPLERLLGNEAKRIADALPEGARTVVMDERGRDLSTLTFSHLLRTWLDEGLPTAFVIGGADGLQPELKARAAMSLRLSSLTLPHALAQLVLCEQLYRAASLLTGHPYHRG